MADTAKISIGGKTIDLPILKGTTGPDVVDIRKEAHGAHVDLLKPGLDEAPAPLVGEGWGGGAAEVVLGAAVITDIC